MDIAGKDEAAAAVDQAEREASRLSVAPDPEAVPWRTAALLVGCLLLLVAFEIALAFSVAKAVTGHAY